MAIKQEDHIIWDAFRNGNQEALEYIYKQHYSALKYYATKFDLSDSQTNDVIQELFVELIESGNKISQVSNIRYYLLGATRNKIYRLKSKEQKKNRNFDALDFSIANSIEDQLIHKEIQENSIQHVIASINNLSQKQQEIIYLRFYNDLSYKEIAEIFNTKAQTVQNLMGRAIRSLKDDFEKKNITKSLILMLFKLQI